MTATCLSWVRVPSEYELLFSFLESFRVDTGQCFWNSEQSKEVKTCDIGEDMGHTVNEVKISLTMPHKTLTGVEEDIQ